MSEWWVSCKQRMTWQKHVAFHNSFFLTTKENKSFIRFIPSHLTTSYQEASDFPIHSRSKAQWWVLWHPKNPKKPSWDTWNSSGWSSEVVPSPVSRPNWLPVTQRIRRAVLWTMQSLRWLRRLWHAVADWKKLIYLILFDIVWSDGDRWCPCSENLTFFKIYFFWSKFQSEVVSNCYPSSGFYWGSELSQLSIKKFTSSIRSYPQQIRSFFGIFVAVSFRFFIARHGRIQDQAWGAVHHQSDDQLLHWTGVWTSDLDDLVKEKDPLVWRCLKNFTSWGKGSLWQLASGCKWL